jgi:hypothetical protein
LAAWWLGDEERWLHHEPTNEYRLQTMMKSQNCPFFHSLFWQRWLLILDTGKQKNPQLNLDRSWTWGVSTFILITRPPLEMK